MVFINICNVADTGPGASDSSMKKSLFLTLKLTERIHMKKSDNTEQKAISERCEIELCEMVIYVGQNLVNMDHVI
jgi:hypothetical protein